MALALILEYFKKFSQFFNLYLSCEVEQQTVNYHISCRVVTLYSGYCVGLATQWSRVRFPTAAGMGDRLWADKPPVFHQASQANSASYPHWDEKLVPAKVK